MHATYIIHHESSNSSANLIVGLGFAMRTQQDEEEPVRIAGLEANWCKDTHSREGDQKRHPPCRHRDLSEASQCRGLCQTYKGDYRLVQKIHLTNQDIGSFCITRNLLHELILQLAEKRRGTKRGGELIE